MSQETPLKSRQTWIFGHSNIWSGNIAEDRTPTITGMEEVVKTVQEIEQRQLERYQGTQQGAGSWKLREQILQVEWSAVQVEFPLEFSSFQLFLAEV